MQPDGAAERPNPGAKPTRGPTMRSYFIAGAVVTLAAIGALAQEAACAFDYGAFEFSVPIPTSTPAPRA
jgi:hypothetical protein